MFLFHPESKKHQVVLQNCKQNIWCLLACVFLVAGCAGTNKHYAVSADSIGEADMSSDGTITLKFRGVGVLDGKQVIGDASVVYKTTDPNYNAILKHLGGMRPGESKFVERWPDPMRGDDIKGRYQSSQTDVERRERDTIAKSNLVYGLDDDALNFLGERLGCRIEALGMGDYSFCARRPGFSRHRA